MSKIALRVPSGSYDIKLYLLIVHNWKLYYLYAGLLNQPGQTFEQSALSFGVSIGLTQLKA